MNPNPLTLIEERIITNGARTCKSVNPASFSLPPGIDNASCPRLDQPGLPAPRGAKIEAQPSVCTGLGTARIILAALIQGTIGVKNRMPIYEFECKKCKAHLEVFQRLNDKQPTKCRKCGGRLERVISAPAIQFKGSGWYVTDYAGKDAKEGKKAESASDAAESASESKSETKETSPAKKTAKSDSSAKLPSGD
jgi:putative FmdB family regulatory protein